MRVTDLHVDGFGVWNQQQLRALSPRVTVLFGANETGKTTLLQFLRTMLYGFAKERRNRYVPPVHGGRAGGNLDVDTHRGRLRIVRHLESRDGQDASDERLALQDPDGRVLSLAVLDQLLMGVDEATFNNVFAVGLRELQELGTLDDTKAADLLYKLTTGLDRVSLVDVMRQLSSSRAALWDPATSTGRIAELLVRRDQLRSQVQAIAQRSRSWIDLEAQTNALVQQSAQLEQQIAQFDRSLHVVEAALQVHELWCQRGVLKRQLDSIGSVQEVSEGTWDQADQLRQALEQQRDDLQRLTRRRRAVRREVAELPMNPTLWSQAARIEALAEHGAWIASLQAQVDQLQGEIGTMQLRLGSSGGGSASRPEPAAEPVPDVAGRALASLRGPAKVFREDGQRLKQAREEAELARLQLEESSGQLEAALIEHGCERLAPAVEAAGALVTRLRRRMQLRQRLDECGQQRDELRRHQSELLDGQVLSLSALAWLGVPFVVGVMLVLGGVFWATAPMLGWPIAVLGLAGWGVSVVAKLTMERTARRELEQSEKQLELLESQIKRAKQERDELDAQLPRGGGSLEVRLAEAEKKLAGLEELLPMEAEVQTARQRVQAAQRKAEQVEAAWKESRGRWRGALRRAELPEDLSPQAVRQWAEGNEQTEHARRRMQHRREELDARQRELNALIARIDDMMLQVQLTPTSDDPHVRLRQLGSALAEQQARHERRRQLREEERRMRRQANHLLRDLRRTRAQRATLLAAAGVKDEKQLQELVHRAEQCRAARQELTKIEQQFRLALGNRCSAEEVERELIDHDQVELQQRQKQLTGRIRQARTELAAVHQHRGELVEQSRALVADRRGSEMQLELSSVARKLDEAAGKWRVLTMVGRVLEVVRELYETQRQPRTLQDASRYFAALTQGQYVRIWTPLSDMSLRVDSASGESLPLDVLSCGTREAVFLSLRLALVADFARRGVMLPLILDDVLVNFDNRRAASAARVLCDFAHAGYQVLMFTCHEHIVQLFETAEAEIRYLSSLGVAPGQELDEVAADEPAEVPLATADEELDDEALDEQAYDEEVEDEYEDEYGDEDEEEVDIELEEEEEDEEVDEEDVVDEEIELEEPEDEPSEYRLAEAEPVLEDLTAGFLWDTNGGSGDASVADLEADDAPEDPADEFDEEPESLTEDEVEPGGYMAAGDTEESSEEAAAADDESEEGEPTSSEPRRQRFTWESPERWWDDYHTGGAAA